MTKLEIYNTYLRVIAKYKDRPFRLRKSIDDLSSDKQIILDRILQVLTSNPEIDPEKFFKAPFEIDPGTSYYLDYFGSYPAIRVYVKYCNKLLLQSCDAQHILEDIQKSYIFIIDFCIKNDICTMDDYFTFRSKEGEVPLFIEHIKYKKINPYIAINNYRAFTWFTANKQTIEFCFGEDFFNKIFHLKSKLSASSKCKKLCDITEKNIEKKLQTNTK